MYDDNRSSGNNKVTAMTSDDDGDDDGKNKDSRCVLIRDGDRPYVASTSEKTRGRACRLVNLVAKASTGGATKKKDKPRMDHQHPMHTVSTAELQQHDCGFTEQ